MYVLKLFFQFCQWQASCCHQCSLTRFYLKLRANVCEFLLTIGFPVVDIGKFLLCRVHVYLGLSSLMSSSKKLHLQFWHLLWLFLLKFLPPLWLPFRINLLSFYNIQFFPFSLLFTSWTVLWNNKPTGKTNREQMSFLKQTKPYA